MELDAFLAHFAAVRAVHPGRQWTAQCPAHEDDSRDTLRIGLGAEAKRLVICMAGCDTARVLEVAGLTVHDLFAGGHAPLAARPPTTYDQQVVTERRHLIDSRGWRFSAYRGEGTAAEAIREWHRAARDVRRVVTERPLLDEEFRWELLDWAAAWERLAHELEAEQDERFRQGHARRG